MTPSVQYLSSLPIGKYSIMPDLVGYITTKEAAENLGYHIEHIRRMLREGDLRGKKIGYMWFVQQESIEVYRKKTNGLGKFDKRRGNQ